MIKSYCDTLHAGKFNHCASICPHGNGVLICWYAGLGECKDDQAVYVSYWTDEGHDPEAEHQPSYEEITSFGPGAGNPIIWAESENEARVMFSLFEEETEKLVEKWIHCSNWTTKITNKEIIEDEPKKVDIGVGYLTRCQPIQLNGLGPRPWLIPMYREHNPFGLILETTDGNEFIERGRIGESDYQTQGRFGKGLLIQPTLWHTGKLLCSLSRDVTKSKVAWYSYSEDEGRTWSDPEPSQISNYNNSLVVINDGSSNPYIIWNQTDEGYKFRTSRYCMALGRLIGREEHPPVVKFLDKLNVYGPGSYPNYCFDSRNRLHIVHTDKPTIRHHVYSSGEAEAEGDNGA